MSSLILHSVSTLAVVVATAFYLPTPSLALLGIPLFMNTGRLKILFLIILGIGIGWYCRFSIDYCLARNYTGIPIEEITAFSGSLITDSQPLDDNRLLYTIALSEVRDDLGRVAAADGKVAVIADKPNPLAVWGEEIALRGSLIPDPNGAAGYKAFIRKRSINSVGNGNLFFRLRRELRSLLIRQMEENLRSQSRGLFLALFLGIGDHLDETLKENFRLAGCIHILALSGFHVGILAALAGFILAPLLGCRGSFAASSLIMLFYLFLVGIRPSLFRAVLMFWIFGGARVLLVKIEAFKGLSCSFLIQMLLFPASALTLSFQLSYAALGGLFLLAPRIQALLPPHFPGWLRQSLAASIAAQMATAPILIPLFGVLYPIGIIASIIETPLITAVMWAGILNFAVGWSQLLAVAGAAIMEILYRIISFSVSIAAATPSWPIASALTYTLCAALISAQLFFSYRYEIAKGTQDILKRFKNFRIFPS